MSNHKYLLQNIIILLFGPRAVGVGAKSVGRGNVATVRTDSAPTMRQ